ncbi:hypothetical protein HPB47_015189, partial [Ixodes persulcatus]
MKFIIGEVEAVGFIVARIVTDNHKVNVLQTLSGGHLTHCIEHPNDGSRKLFLASAGSNDQMDMRAAISGLERKLKTGIISATKDSNVAHSSSCQTLPLPANKSAGQNEANAFPKEATA